MNFIPEQSKNSQKVPYYEDVTSADGWQGHTTQKTVNALQSEISQSISRLGGLVTGFQKGTFQSEEGNRDGFRVHYAIEATDGRQVPGRIDIAALPIRRESNREKSLKMALYMFHIALNGTWFLQQLSPGYSALVPFMLGQGDKTLSQMWTESPIMNNLLPPGEEEFIDGEVTVVT